MSERASTAIKGTVELRGWDDTSTGRWTVNVLVNRRTVGSLVLTAAEYAVLSAALGNGSERA